MVVSRIAPGVTKKTKAARRCQRLGDPNLNQSCLDRDINRAAHSTFTESGFYSTCGSSAAMHYLRRESTIRNSLVQTPINLNVLSMFGLREQYLLSFHITP
jgi:hypothetical protein